jgi:hypothetical protein
MKSRAALVLQSALLGVLLPGLTGCHSIGPGTVPRDRSDYSTALADSWKSMMLLNIVKTRYLDLPIFLDVGQVVTGYSLETSLSLNGSWATMGNGNSLGLGSSGTYSDHPTITYTPLTGDKFLQGFMNPVPPGRVFALVQSGYAADFILQMGVESLNGLRNHPVTLGSQYKADPEFFRVLKLLREVQGARAVGMQVEHATNGLPATVMFFRGDRITPEVQAKITELRELLGLPPGQSAFRLVASPLRGNAGELGVDTRSVWQILASLSLGVEVPPKHRQLNLTPPVSETPAPDLLLLRVHSGPARPASAYVSVPYEGQWFWIANDDWKSKRTFTSILFLFTLADTGATQNLPTLTIPTR